MRPAKRRLRGGGRPALHTGAARAGSGHSAPRAFLFRLMLAASIARLALIFLLELRRAANQDDRRR